MMTEVGKSALLTLVAGVVVYGVVAAIIAYVVIYVTNNGGLALIAFITYWVLITLVIDWITKDKEEYYEG
jgi:hypothetical protein